MHLGSGEKGIFKCRRIHLRWNTRLKTHYHNMNSFIRETGNKWLFRKILTESQIAVCVRELMQSPNPHRRWEHSSVVFLSLSVSTTTCWIMSAPLSAPSDFLSSDWLIYYWSYREGRDCLPMWWVVWMKTELMRSTSNGNTMVAG